MHRRVWYRQSDKTEAPALVVSVNLSLKPPSYGVRLDGGTGGTRETERDRLRSMAAEAKPGMVTAADIRVKEAKVCPFSYLHCFPPCPDLIRGRKQAQLPVSTSVV